MRMSSTKVPFVEPRSSTYHSPYWGNTRAWREDVYSSSSTRVHEGARPTTIPEVPSGRVVPRSGPEVTTSRPGAARPGAGREGGPAGCGVAGGLAARRGRVQADAARRGGPGGGPRGGASGSGRGGWRWGLRGLAAQPAHDLGPVQVAAQHPDRREHEEPEHDEVAQPQH